jgi:hypothetical protein
MVCTTRRIAAATFAVVIAAGCASQQGKATKAIAAADSALQTVSADAQAYVPDQYKTLSDELAAARADIQAKNYADGLTKAGDVSTKVGELPAAVEAAKTRLAASWQTMSDSVPGMVKAIQTKVDELSKMRRLPAGMDKAKMDAAKASLSQLTASWTQAMDAYKNGKLADAVSMASDVKGKAGQTMSTLGMKK